MSNRVGVTVDTCVCLLASMNNVHHKNIDSPDHVRLSSHTQSTTMSHALFAAVVCCCVVALPSTECYCWAVAYVQVNVPCYIWVTCSRLSLHLSSFFSITYQVWAVIDTCTLILAWLEVSINIPFYLYFWWVLPSYHVFNVTCFFSAFFNKFGGKCMMGNKKM